MNDHPVNLALTRAPVVEGVFLWAGASLLDRTGIAPGQPVEVRLRPPPTTVSIPTPISRPPCAPPAPPRRGRR